MSGKADGPANRAAADVLLAGERLQLSQPVPLCHRLARTSWLSFGEDQAAAWVIQRFGVRPLLAAVVAHHAGLGGRVL
jgi:hypothetical protein